MDQQELIPNSDNEQQLIETNNEQEEMILTSALDERYGIKKATRNQRLAHLRMKAYKKGKLYYVTPEQVAILDEFDQHIKKHGTFEGFPLPAPSGPWDEEEHDQEEAAAIVPTESSEIEQQQQPEQINLPDQSGFVGINSGAIASNARLMAKEILFTQMLGENLAKNPDLLPEEDRAEIEAMRLQFQQAFPQERKRSPKELAQQLLELSGAGRLNQTGEAA